MPGFVEYYRSGKACGLMLAAWFPFELPTDSRLPVSGTQTPLSAVVEFSSG